MNLPAHHQPLESNEQENQSVLIPEKPACPARTPGRDEVGENQEQGLTSVTLIKSAVNQAAQNCERPVFLPTCVGVLSTCVS